MSPIGTFCGALGIIIGILAALFGIAMIYESIRLLRKRNENEREIKDLHLNYLVILSGATKHYLMGHVDLMYVPPSCIRIMVGAQIGTRVAKKLKGCILTLAFAVVLLILSLRIFLKGLGLPVP